MIPPLDPRTGRLPFDGPDRPVTVSLDEIYGRFVGGTGSTRRDQIWSAFNVWHSLAQAEFPGCTYWISGSFVTENPLPSDLDVILVYKQNHAASFDPVVRDQARVLLSHLSVQALQPPGFVEKLQPMGALVDGFVCAGWMPEHVDVWQQRWSTEYDKITHEPTGVRMGYLQVVAT